MAAAGAPLRAIQEWMGRRDYKTTLIMQTTPDATQGRAYAERAFGSEQKRDRTEQQVME